MPVRILLLLIVATLLYVERVANAEVTSSPAAKQIGSVYGKAITAADIELAAPIDTSVRFDARDQARWELMERIAVAFGKPVADRFKTDHKIDATAEEIEAFKRNMAAINARRAREAEAELAELHDKLATANLAVGERAKLVQQQSSLEKTQVRLKRAEASAVEDDVAKVFITTWKLERELHRTYGGRVIFQQFGAEALDGRRLLYEEAEKKGDLKFDDPGVRHMFYYYAVNMKHTTVENEVLEKPWFFGEPTDQDK